MIELTTEQGRKLAALSQQLRVLHTELADQSEDLRREQLRDEVQRAMSALPPQDREGFLKALKERFPIWSGEASETDQFAQAAWAAAAREAAAPAPPADPKAMAQKLVEMCQSGTLNDRAVVMRILMDGGLAPQVRTEARTEARAPEPKPVAAAVTPPLAPAAAPAAKGETIALAPGQSLTELKRALGVPGDATLDSTRVVELASILTEFVVKLEPWACQYWKDIAPDARTEVPPTVARTLSKFAAGGDEKANKDAVARETYRLRSLVSLLMKGVREAGKQYARDHMSRFGVDAITKESKASFTKGQATANWETYVRLMEGVDANWIEQRIRKLIAQDVDAALAQVVNK